MHKRNQGVNGYLCHICLSVKCHNTVTTRSDEEFVFFKVKFYYMSNIKLAIKEDN